MFPRPLKYSISKLGIVDTRDREQLKQLFLFLCCLCLRWLVVTLYYIPMAPNWDVLGFKEREKKRKVNTFVRDYVIISHHLGWFRLGLSTQRRNQSWNW